MKQIPFLLSVLFLVCDCRPTNESKKNSKPTKPTEEELDYWERFKNSICEQDDVVSSIPVRLEDKTTYQDIYPIAIWPNANIPYVISSAISDKARLEILRAMERIENVSCVQFVNNENIPNDTFHLNILPISCVQRDVNNMTICGVSTAYGYVPQLISKGFSAVFINDRCNEYYSTALHELFHVLGFIHEFSRWDRDDHIEVSSESHGYKVHQEDDPTAPFGFPFDYESITNYGKIEVKVPGIVGVIKEPEDLSETDIQELNLLYQCDQKSNVQQYIDSIVIL